MEQKIKIIKLESLDVKPQYKLFVDYTENKKGEFCLVKIGYDVWEELLSGTGTDLDDFKERIQNLSKYFNAVIYEKQPDAK